MLASPSTLVASSSPPAAAAEAGHRSGRVTSRDLVLAGCTLLLAAVLTGGANLVFTVVAAAPALLASIRLIQKKNIDTEAKNSVLLYWAVLAAFTLVEGLMPESHTASYALFKAFILLAVGGHVFLKTKTDLFAAAIGVVDGLAEDLDTCLSALTPLMRSPNYPSSPAWPTPVSPTPTVLSPDEVEAIELESLRTAMSITPGDLEELKVPPPVHRSETGSCTKHKTRQANTQPSAISTRTAARPSPRGALTLAFVHEEEMKKSFRARPRPSHAPRRRRRKSTTRPSSRPTRCSTAMRPAIMLVFPPPQPSLQVYLSGTAGARHGALFVQNTSEVPLWWVLKTNHHGRLLAAPNHGALGVDEMVKLNETEAAKTSALDTLAIDFVLNPPMRKFNEKVFQKAKPERHMIDIVYSE